MTMQPKAPPLRDGPKGVPPEWNRISSMVIGAAMSVHSEIGPGLLERFYEVALEHELGLVGLRVRRQHPVRVGYKGVDLGLHVLDLVVEDLIVLELKAVEQVHDHHLAQLVSSMRLAKLPLGLLINFNVASLKDGLYRRILSKGSLAPDAFLEEP